MVSQCLVQSYSSQSNPLPKPPHLEQTKTVQLEFRCIIFTKLKASIETINNKDKRIILNSMLWLTSLQAQATNRFQNTTKARLAKKSRINNNCEFQICAFTMSLKPPKKQQINHLGITIYLQLVLKLKRNKIVIGAINQLQIFTSKLSHIPSCFCIQTLKSQ